MCLARTVKFNIMSKNLKCNLDQNSLLDIMSWKYKDALE